MESPLAQTDTLAANFVRNVVASSLLMALWFRMAETAVICLMYIDNAWTRCTLFPPAIIAQYARNVNHISGRENRY
jgi:hypothetical protein